MGLDTVELVLAVEEHYGVELDTPTLSKTRRVGELLDLIVEATMEQQGNALLRQDVADWLASYLVAEFGIPRQDIHVDSRFVEDLRLDQ